MLLYVPLGGLGSGLTGDFFFTLCFCAILSKVSATSS